MLLLTTLTRRFGLAFGTYPDWNVMDKCDAWIEKNYNDLYLRDDELSRSIVALYLLSQELHVVSAAIYLGTTSADYVPQLRKCFEQYLFSEGIAWIESLERAYGTLIHPDKESREDYLLRSPAALVRLDHHSDQDTKTLASLLPKMDALLDRLVAEKKME